MNAENEGWALDVCSVDWESAMVLDLAKRDWSAGEMHVCSVDWESAMVLDLEMRDWSAGEVHHYETNGFRALVSVLGTIVIISHWLVILCEKAKKMAHLVCGSNTANLIHRALFVVAIRDEFKLNYRRRLRTI